MTAVNLGVCFGPSLLRPEVETVSSIYDIKFRNAIVELTIVHYEKMFKAKLDERDIEVMVGSNEHDEQAAANLSNSLSSLAVSRDLKEGHIEWTMVPFQSITRRPPSTTSEMMKTTIDSRQRGLCNPDYGASSIGKSSFGSNSDETTKKDCMYCTLTSRSPHCNDTFFLSQRVQAVAWNHSVIRHRPVFSHHKVPICSVVKHAQLHCRIIRDKFHPIIRIDFRWQTVCHHRNSRRWAIRCHRSKRRHRHHCNQPASYQNCAFFIHRIDRIPRCWSSSLDQHEE